MACGPGHTTKAIGMQNEPGTTDETQVLPMEVVKSDMPPATGPQPPLVGTPPLPLGLTKKRLALAFAIAALSDLISLATNFIPPLQWALDLATAGALFAVLGFRWLLLPGLIMEAIPEVSVLPFWVLAVSAVAVWGSVRPKLN